MLLVYYSDDRLFVRNLVTPYVIACYFLNLWFIASKRPESSCNVVFSSSMITDINNLFSYRRIKFSYCCYQRITIFFLRLFLFYSLVIMKWLPFWVKFSADSISKYFSDFSQKTGTDTSCKLSPNNFHEMSNLVF